MKLEIPNFSEKSELFKWLVENKTTLITQKKFEVKHCDAISFTMKSMEKESDDVDKAENTSLLIDADRVKVKLIINTTKIMDSHSDVHFDGIWKKTISESGDIYLLKEHRMTFDSIISDSMKAYTKNISWDKLGAPFEGNTQALVFEGLIDKGRNTYMYDQYVKGYVKNHSVGMRYVKLYLAINDKGYSAEYDAWNKYFPEVANKDEVEEQGYFWAVTEAKLIEGSAVVKGSNWVTPTISVVADNENKETPIVVDAPIVEETKSNFYNINLY